MKLVKLGQVLRAAVSDVPDAVTKDNSKLERISSLAAQVSKQMQEVKKMTTPESLAEGNEEMLTPWLDKVSVHLNRLDIVVKTLKKKATELWQEKLEQHVTSLRVIAKGGEDGQCWRDGLRPDCEYQELLQKSDTLLAPSMARRLHTAFTELIKDRQHTLSWEADFPGKLRARGFRKIAPL